uniref:Ribosomal protein S3 n=1 Tax=Rhizaria sp. TaxID=2204297 RepID=A0A5P8DJU7_9EUKA|nr:ribosomal protein S3 [Rhizaria sp.]
MTRKTNSLLFRLGVTSLWETKLSNFRKIFATFRLEKILHTELIKYKWNILSIKWNNNNAVIQVYSSFNLSRKLKQSLFKYYKKVKNIKKLSEKFSINNSFITSILKNIRIIYLGNKSFKLLKLNFFILFFKKWELYIITHILFLFNKFSWVKLNLVLQSFLLKKKIKKNYELSVFNIKTLRYKLQKINGFIYFKILSIFVENILFNTTKQFMNVSFNNIWHNKGLLFKFVSKDKFLLQLLLLSCVYNNSQIFSEYIAFQLKRNKNHKKLLRKIILCINSFWQLKKIVLRGIQLRVTGKLDGKMRKSKYHYDIGKVQLQTLKTFLHYSFCVSYTQFGIISIKFWIIYENK